MKKKKKMMCLISGIQVGIGDGTSRSHDLPSLFPKTGLKRILSSGQLQRSGLLDENAAILRMLIRYTY